MNSEGRRGSVGAWARWNRYGYEAEAFDKYREAVRKSNRGSVRVLSVLGIACALPAVVFWMKAGQEPAGLACGLALLAAGITGAAVSFRRDCSGRSLLFSGCFLSLAFYMAAACCAVRLDADVIWAVVQVAAGCYLLDCAWRAGVLQLLSWIMLNAAWYLHGVPVPGQRTLFSALFLAAGLVTFYAVNRSRVSLIMGGEESPKQADTDPLTGLPVRAEARREIEEHLETDGQGAMMLLALDRFGNVNDRLGRRMGDRVLAEVAADLKKMFRNSDVLCRLAGDEFVVYMKSVPEKEWAMQRASHAVRKVRRWVGNGTTNIQVTASVGIVMTGMVSRTFDDLYRAADIAMYCAKAEGGNKALFYSRDLLDQREAKDRPHRAGTDGPDLRGNEEPA